MDLNEIAIFAKVVQKGSFTAAANELRMPKSTVSMKISSLERRLGITLLKRSTRKLQLTAAGENFFRRTTVGLEEILAAENALLAEKAEPQGKIRITTPVDVGQHAMSELMSDFLRKYPKVQIELLLTDRRVDLLGEGIDLAIRAGQLKDSSLIAKKVGVVSFGIFASPRYLKARGTPLQPRDLSTHDCLVFSPFARGEWRLQSGKKEVTVSIKEKAIVNDLRLVHKMAVLGDGLALLPSFMCPTDDKVSKLSRVLPEWSSGENPIHFVYPAQKFVQPAISAFIEFSAPLLKEKFQDQF